MQPIAARYEDLSRSLSELLFEQANAMPPEVIRQLLPDMAAEWVSLIGVGPTLALVRNFPGIQMKVPIGDKPGKMSRRLGQVIGEEQAARFMQRHGGEHLCIPRCAGLWRSMRDALIVQSYDRGVKVHELCIALGLSERQIRVILGNKK